VAAALGVKPQSPATRRDRERQRQDTDLSLPADNAESKERCSVSSARSSSGLGRAVSSENRGDSVILLKLWPRRQRGYTRSCCRQGFGRAGGVEAAFL